MTDEKVHYLTPQGLDALKKEYDELKNIKIPEIANRIDEAKQQGDLSENAEYHQAKEDMAWAQGRLMEVRYVLDRAQVMEPGSKKSEVVNVGSTVKTKVNGNERQYTIVGPQEADPLAGKISNESPLGAAFLGAKAGDKVAVRTPAGEQIYKIIEIN
ncbi:transcription elongation factor GreA [Patescibacteria group bacterium]|nr:MAG: transcription elongation factor GreA [Patescibacteria group bacterium]